MRPRSRGQPPIRFRSGATEDDGAEPMRTPVQRKPAANDTRLELSNASFRACPSATNSQPRDTRAPAAISEAPRKHGLAPASRHRTGPGRSHDLQCCIAKRERGIRHGAVLVSNEAWVVLRMISRASSRFACDAIQNSPQIQGHTGHSCGRRPTSVTSVTGHTSMLRSCIGRRKSSPPSLDRWVGGRRRRCSSAIARMSDRVVAWRASVTGS